MTGTAETEAAEFATTYNMPGGAHPHQRAHGPHGPARPHLQVRGRQVRRRGRRHRRALRDRPARAGGHGVGGQVRAAVAPARAPGHPAPGPERQAAHPGGRDRGPGRAAARRDGGHQHGRPWRRHPARRATPRAWPATRRSARASTSTTEEGAAEYEKLLARFEKECAEEGDQIRELGGLYVLGSERHESRRIDNQLRGRSGRQGDPGESRFFLSLEDELMRLFATGAMQWVMSRTLPDDVPIEAKMVTKAIERAQHTVEGRNAEIRKDVLKYDEVLNEQRKVIYARRLQVIDGEDLRERTEELLEETIDELVRSACPGEFPEEWELERLLAEVTQYYPTAFTVEDLAEADHRHADRREPPRRGARRLPRPRRGVPRAARTRRARWSARSCCRSSTSAGATTWPRWTTCARASTCGPWASRTRWWRGRARASRCSAQMMDAIDDDYLRYVMHVQVVAEAGAEPDLTQASYQAADDPVQGASLLEAMRGTIGRPRWPRRARGCPRGHGRRGACPCPGARSRPRHQADDETHGAPGEGPDREARAQRAVLVRERQEVQALPWRGLSRRPGPASQRDLPGGAGVAPQAPRRGRGLPGPRPAAGAAGRARDRGVAPRPVGRPRRGPAGHLGVRLGERRHRPCSRTSAPTLSRRARTSTSSCVEEADDSVAGELTERRRRPDPAVRRTSSCARCSPASTTSATPSPSSTPAPGAPTPRTGAR